MARKRRHNGGAQEDVLRAERRRRKGGQTVEARPARGHPGGLDAQLLGTFDGGQHLVDVVSTNGNTTALLTHALSSLCSVWCSCVWSPEAPEGLVHRPRQGC